MALKCTNTSLLPSSGAMNPNPLASLNHFTVPFAMSLSFTISSLDYGPDLRVPLPVFSSNLLQSLGGCMHPARWLWILILLPGLSFAASAQGLDTTEIDKALGRSGQKIGDVYKVGFPRTDLHVSVHGVAIKPGLALGSWAAFTGTNEKAMVMGDLVLLQEELDPVMEKLRTASFEIS